ncbi:hypothetical protein LJB77_02165 [Ruminococcaceae bacterium OttesenSCG-928-N02]|nr:hypothetical protein [Ruminococcaceae bacterium OttesenSCG-928-N02]
MQNFLELDFLMGATSPGGFHGYFDTLQAKGSDWRLALIKAGPGAGKSTLMKKVANHFTAQGMQVELVYCSSDPTSLDGVICQGAKFAILDATSPHTLNAKYPGAFEEVISLYPCADNKLLRANAQDIIQTTNACSACHTRAARYISAACALLADTQRLAQPYTNVAKATAYGEMLCAKHLPQTNEEGREEVRMLSAMTFQGPLVYRQTVSRMADNIVVLEDNYGVAANIVLRALREKAIARGYTVYTCYCPTAPGEKIEHILIPQAGFAAVTSNHFHPMAYPGRRVVHCTRFYNKTALENRRTRVRFNRKMAAELIGEAATIQHQAKTLHDKMETYYIAATDFKKVNEISETLLASLAK